MAIQHTLSLNWTRSGEQIAKNVTIGLTDDAEQNADVTLTTAQVDKNVTMAFTVALLKLLYISADIPITVETNATGHAGGEVLTLAADKPLVWYEGCGMTCPLATNVTTLYLTNLSSVSTGTVKIRAIMDAVP